MTRRALLTELALRRRGVLLAALLAMIVHGAVTAVFAWLTGPALRFVLTGGEEGRVRPVLDALGLGGLGGPWVLPGLVAALAVIKGVAYLTQFYTIGLFGQRVGCDLRLRVFSRMLALSPDALSDRREGDLVGRLLNDVTAVEVGATYALGAAIRDVLQIAFLAAVAFALDWQLALLTLGVLPLAIIPAARLTRATFRRFALGHAGMGAISARLAEGLGALKTIHAYDAQPVEARRLAKHAKEHREAMVSAAWARGAVPSLMEVMGAMVLAAVLAWAASRNSASAADLVSILTAIILIYQPAKELGRISQVGAQATAGLERLMPFVDPAEPASQGANGATNAEARAPVARNKSPKRAHGNKGRSPATVEPEPPSEAPIRLEGVTFQRKGRVVLESLDLELLPGRITALVGPSGGGKSTVTSLLLRFMSPTLGRITVGGIDAETFSPERWRRLLALVSQEPMLFDTTLRENVLLGRPDADRGDLERALATVGLEELIQALPDGLETRVGERGARLSGGQRQRVCLARAVLSEAPFIILDEATSNLDPVGEAEVTAAMRSALEGRSALVVAHRLASIRFAHRIHFLERGRIVESGSHDELLAMDGSYAGAWALQGGTR